MDYNSVAHYMGSSSFSLAIIGFQIYKSAKLHEIPRKFKVRAGQGHPR